MESTLVPGDGFAPPSRRMYRLCFTNLTHQVPVVRIGEKKGDYHSGLPELHRLNCWPRILLALPTPT